MFCIFAVGKYQLNYMGFKGGAMLSVSAATKVRIYKDKNGQEIKDPFYETFNYPQSHVRRYHYCIMQLAGINGLARDLMDWLTIRMDNDNVVRNMNHDKDAFIDYLKDAAKEHSFDYNIPSHRSIDRAWALLLKRGMLFKKSKGVYIVNPEFFMSSRNQKRRKLLIRIFIEFKNDTHTIMKVVRSHE